MTWPDLTCRVLTLPVLPPARIASNTSPPYFGPEIFYSPHHPSPITSLPCHTWSKIIQAQFGFSSLAWYYLLVPLPLFLMISTHHNSLRLETSPPSANHTLRTQDSSETRRNHSISVAQVRRWSSFRFPLRAVVAHADSDFRNTNNVEIRLSERIYLHLQSIHSGQPTWFWIYYKRSSIVQKMPLINGLKMAWYVETHPSLACSSMYAYEVVHKPKTYTHTHTHPLIDTLPIHQLSSIC